MNNIKQNKSKKGELKLNQKQKIFCREYIKCGNGTQAAIKAGYSKNTARHQASQLLTKRHIKAEIDRISERKDKKAIMDAQEVMELYSAIARGEVKDQFGLEASLADRIKAMNEIAKRTIDIDNRIKGIPDQNNQLNINVHWRKSNRKK